MIEKKVLQPHPLDPYQHLNPITDLLKYNSMELRLIEDGFRHNHVRAKSRPVTENHIKKRKFTMDTVNKMMDEAVATTKNSLDPKLFTTVQDFWNSGENKNLTAAQQAKLLFKINDVEFFKYNTGNVFENLAATDNEVINRNNKPRPSRLELGQQKLDQEAMIARFNNSNRVVQPTFMKDSGSMCFTEFWSEKQRNSYYTSVKGDFNTVRVGDKDDDQWESLYRPNKIKSQRKIKNQMSKLNNKVWGESSSATFERHNITAHVTNTLAPTLSNSTLRLPQLMINTNKSMRPKTSFNIPVCLTDYSPQINSKMSSLSEDYSGQGMSKLVKTFCERNYLGEKQALSAGIKEASSAHLGNAHRKKKKGVSRFINNLRRKTLNITGNELEQEASLSREFDAKSKHLKIELSETRDTRSNFGEGVTSPLDPIITERVIVKTVLPKLNSDREMTQISNTENQTDSNSDSEEKEEPSSFTNSLARQTFTAGFR